MRSTIVLLAGLLITPQFAHAQFPKIKPPKISPPKINPPKIDLPKIDPSKLDPSKLDPSKLDPLKAAREELERARKNAMKGLKKMSPETVFSNIKKSLDREVAKAGVKANKKTGDVDLRQTSFGKGMNRWLKAFAQGNEGKGEVEVLKYNARSRVMEMKLYARHRQRQNWGALGKVDLYDVTQRVKFNYNFRSGKSDYEIDLGPLAPRINKKVVQALQEGDLVKAAQSAGPQIIGKAIKFERKNDYDKILADLKRKHGSNNVYLASRDFVAWGGSESIGKYAVTGVASGGSALAVQIMKDAKTMAAKELPHIVAWLEKLGEKNARSMAQALLTGKKPNWPYIKFEIVTIPHYAREVDGLKGTVKTPWRRFNNLGFVIVFQPKFKK